MDIEYRRDGNQPLRKFNDKDEKRYQKERKDDQRAKAQKAPRGGKR